MGAPCATWRSCLSLRARCWDLPRAGPGGTKLYLTYAVTGYTVKGMNTWAAPADSVLTQEFQTS